MDSVCKLLILTRRNVFDNSVPIPIPILCIPHQHRHTCVVMNRKYIQIFRARATAHAQTSEYRQHLAAVQDAAVAHAEQLDASLREAQADLRGTRVQLRAAQNAKVRAF